MTERAARLVQELEHIGLSAVDAHRGAFTALAVSAGWPNVRIGRYLGVTRMRVFQRVEKMAEWARRDDCPALAEIDWTQDRSKGKRVASVGYKQDDWADIEFARSIIDTVGNAPS